MKIIKSFEYYTTSGKIDLLTEKYVPVPIQHILNIASKDLEFNNVIEFTEDEINKINSLYNELTKHQRNIIEKEKIYNIYKTDFHIDNSKWFPKQTIFPKYIYGQKGSKYTITLLTANSYVFIYKDVDNYYIEELVLNGRYTNHFICNSFNDIKDCLTDIVYNYNYILRFTKNREIEHVFDVIKKLNNDNIKYQIFCDEFTNFTLFFTSDDKQIYDKYSKICYIDRVIGRHYFSNDKLLPFENITSLIKFINYLNKYGNKPNLPNIGDYIHIKYDKYLNKEWNNFLSENIAIVKKINLKSAMINLEYLNKLPKGIAEYFDEKSEKWRPEYHKINLHIPDIEIIYFSKNKKNVEDALAMFLSTEKYNL